MKISLYEPLTTLGITGPDFQMQATSTLADPSADLISALVGFPTAAGKIVTKETAIRIAAFLSGVKMLAGDIAKMPLILRETTTVNGRQHTQPALDNPLYPILHDVPNEWQTSYQMRFFLASQLIMAGNCFAQVIRDGTGKILQLNPLNAWHMQARWDLTQPGKPVLYWYYSDAHGNIRTFFPKDLWHTTSINVEGSGIEGSRLIVLAREALSVLQAAEETAGRTFANSLGMQGFISAPVDSEITEPEAQNVVDTLKRDFSGSQSAGKFTLLPGDLKFVPMSWNPKDSQLLESRQFNEISVVRLLGGAPLLVKLGMGEKNSTYASSSAFLDEYFNTSLLPYTTSLEQSISRDLIAPKDRSRVFAKHNADIILRGSPKERAETYAAQINSFQMTPNEARVLEDRDTIEGGDVLFFPQNSGIYDIETGEYFLASQQADEKEPATAPIPEGDGDEPDVEGGETPPTPVKGKKQSPPIKKQAAKAEARLIQIANSLAERCERKFEKSGTLEPKFVAEVMSVSLEKAIEVCKGPYTSKEEYHAALVACALGENDDN